MRHVLSILLGCSISLASWAAEDDDFLVNIPPGGDIHEVLVKYQMVSGKPVYLAMGVYARVTLQHPTRLPRAEALELIRKTLLERYGIEIRTNALGETLVEFSKDPKYPPRSDEPVARENKEESKQSRRLIRIIRK